MLTLGCAVALSAVAPAVDNLSRYPSDLKAAQLPKGRALAGAFKLHRRGRRCAPPARCSSSTRASSTHRPEGLRHRVAKTRLFRWTIKADAFKKAEQEGNLPGFWPGETR